MSLMIWILALNLITTQQAAEIEDVIPLDISANDFDGSQQDGLLIYIGDVNVVYGDMRLRADRVEAQFEMVDGAWSRSPSQILANDNVYYISSAGIARSDTGVYDLKAGTIEMTGSVVLTQGCNVSTGNFLVVDLNTNRIRLSGGGKGDRQRVRSVFYDTPQQAQAQNSADCPVPRIPGNGPQPFDDTP